MQKFQFPLNQYTKAKLHLTNQCTRITTLPVLEIGWANGVILALNAISPARNRYTELSNLVIENYQVQPVEAD